MLDAYKCLTKACTADINIVSSWQKNNYCNFVEAECLQCLQIYWYILRDGKYFLHYREQDKSFDNRRKLYTIFRTKKGPAMTNIQMTLSLDDIVNIVISEQLDTKPSDIEKKKILLERYEEEHLLALETILKENMLDIISGLKVMFGKEVSFAFETKYMSVNDTDVRAIAILDSEFGSGEFEFTFPISDEELESMPTYIAYTELELEVETLQGQTYHSNSYEYKQKLKNALIAHMATTYNIELLEKAKELSQSL